MKRRPLVSSEAVRDLRKSMGLSLVQFADRVPISRRALIDYEQGRYGVTRLIVAKRLKEMAREHRQAQGDDANGTGTSTAPTSNTATSSPSPSSAPSPAPTGPQRRRLV